VTALERQTLITTKSASQHYLTLLKVGGIRGAWNNKERIKFNGNGLGVEEIGTNGP
jgi:hypothetical protein